VEGLLEVLLVDHSAVDLLQDFDLVMVVLEVVLEVAL